MMGETIMLALAGEQPMPNLIPVLQHRPRIVRFIVSGRTESHAQNTITALNLDRRTKRVDADIEPRIDPYDIGATEQACLDVVKRFGAKNVVFNITGGTKTMVIGAYQAALRHRLPMIYVVTEKGKILHLHPDGSRDEEEITARVSVPVYFAAHGITASVKRPWPEKYQDIARYLAQHLSGATRVLDAARQCISNSLEPTLIMNPTAEERAVVQTLADQELMSKTPAAEGLLIQVQGGAKACDFLCGKWLEVHVYAACAAREDLFDFVAGDVRIRKPAGAELVLNQLDGAVTRKARLTICSCKTERHELEDKGENKGIIYELDSISRREQAGIYCGKVLVTQQVDLPAAFRARAKNSKLRIIDGSELTNVAEIIAKVTVKP
jgi:hypothetical protein